MKEEGIEFAGHGGSSECFAPEPVHGQIREWSCQGWRKQQGICKLAGHTWSSGVFGITALSMMFEGGLLRGAAGWHT